MDCYDFSRSSLPKTLDSELWSSPTEKVIERRTAQASHRIPGPAGSVGCVVPQSNRSSYSPSSLLADDPPDLILPRSSQAVRRSCLNRHLHFHVVTTSGTFKPDDDDGSLVFFQATKLDDCRFNTLTEVVRRRILRYLVRHDLLDEWDASQMLTWQGHGGFSINGSVACAADDRFGLERLLRYCARPAFASNRLARIGDQQLIYKLPPGDVWGRDHIKLSPMELLDRLAALIPPPRRHRHTYVGAFAPE